MLKEQLSKPSLLSLSTAATQVAPRVPCPDERLVFRGVLELSPLVTTWFGADPVVAFEAACRIAATGVRALEHKDALFSLLGLWPSMKAASASSSTRR